MDKVFGEYLVKCKVNKVAKADAKDQEEAKGDEQN